MADRDLKVRISAEVAGFVTSTTRASQSLDKLRASALQAASAIATLQAYSTQAGQGIHSLATVQQQAAAQINSANNVIIQSSNQATQSINELTQNNNNYGSSANSAGTAAQGMGSKLKQLAVAVGVGAAVKSAAAVFGDFEQSLNQFQVNAGATGEQMDQVKVKARELGKQVAGLSASDAAQAMLELAKGGLSADQAMTAAAGTMNLAAAAQISAGEAAEIQSAALNTFALDAGQANKVADVLANTAAAASGDITDFAQGLAQAGLPAKGLGISIEDTSTALAVFAKNGVSGSDAGTSLKTMLIALTKPTSTAQAALDDLGVKAFDAQGNFVGLKTVSDQLAQASSRMTTEQYAAATATAFGTDAVRGATAFAAEGAAGYQALADKIGVVGGAQSQAEANTKGLKGALDAIKASAEDAAIGLGDKLGGKATDLARKISEIIPELTTSLTPAIEGIGTGAVTAFGLLSTAAGTAVAALSPIFSVLGSAGAAFSGLSGPIQSVARALGVMLLLRGRIAAFATGIAGGFRTAAAGAATFRTQVMFLQSVGIPRLQAVSATAAGVIGKSFRGLSKALGGGIGIALIAVTSAVAFFAGKNAESTAKVQAHSDAVDELAGTLDKATGSLSDASKASIVDNFGKAADGFSRINLSAGSAAQAIIDMEKDGGASAQRFRESIVSQLDFDVIGKNLSSSGVNFVDTWASALDMAQTDILKTVAVGGPALAELEQRLLATGRAPSLVTAGINRLRGDIQGMPADISPASGALSAFTDQMDIQTRALGLGADQVLVFRQNIAAAAEVDFGRLSVGLDHAAESGLSLEQSLSLFGLADKAPEVIKLLGEQAVDGGNGMHYFGEAGAAAVEKLQAAKTAAEGAAEGVEGTAAAAEKAAVKLTGVGNSVPVEALAALHEKADVAADTSDGLADALGRINSESSYADSSANYLIATLQRLAGGNADAEQNARNAAAAVRDIAAAARDEAAAKDGVAQKTQDLADARVKEIKDGYTVEQRTRDVAAAERDLAAATDGTKDAADRSLESQRKAAEAGITVANDVALAALGQKGYEAAVKAGTAEVQRQRDAFIKSAIAAGDSSKSIAVVTAEAEKAADRAGLIPKNFTTVFKADIAAAEAGGKKLVQVYDPLTKTYSTKALLDDEIATAQANGLQVKFYDKLTKTYKSKAELDKAQAEQDLAAFNKKKADDKKAKVVLATENAKQALADSNDLEFFDKRAKAVLDGTGAATELRNANAAPFRDKMATLDADAAPANSVLARLTAVTVPGKSFGIDANNAGALTAISETGAAANALPDVSRKITYTGAVSGSGRSAPIAVATGGLIRGPGTGTSDSIPARLSDGEYVINARQTAKHRSLLEQINQGAQGFATGGIVGTQQIADYQIGGSKVGAADFDKLTSRAVQKMAPAAGAALQAAAAKLALTGGAFSVGSGNWGPPNTSGLAANTLAAQKYVQSHFGINNIGGWRPSGSVSASDHPKGKALDVMIANWQAAAGIAKGNEVAGYFTGHPNDFGTKYAIWRNQIDTGSGWRPYTRSDGGNNSDPTLAHMDHVHVSFLSGPAGPLASAGGGAGGGAAPAGSGVDRWLPLARSVFNAKGAPLSALPVMMAQMRRESSGKPRAINLTDINAQRGTPSKGLLQFIDPTFRAYADPGYNSNIWDPESQIRAFINYVPARYGSFDYLTRIGNGAYAEGGRVAGPGSSTSDSILARLSDGEYVINAKQTAKYGELLHAINSGAPGFAAGGGVGIPSSRALSGASVASYGERQGSVRDALGDLPAALTDLRERAAQAASGVRDSTNSLRDAQKSAAEVAKEQSRKISAAIIGGERDVADHRKANSEALAKAEERLSNARKKETKTAAQRAARAAAIVVSERNLGQVRRANVAALARAQQVGALGEAKARIIAAAANAASDRKVAAAEKALRVDRAARAELERRSTVAARVYRRDADLRSLQIRMASRFDRATTSLAAAEGRLSDAREKAADQRRTGRDDALGIRGGILGSDDFQGTSVTAATIRKQLQSAIAGAAQKDSVVARAGKLGISGSILEKLSGDFEGKGGIVLRGIASGRAADAKAINSLYATLGNIGSKTGGRVADRLGITQAITTAQNQVASQKQVISLTGAALKDLGRAIGAQQAASLKGQKLTLMVDGRPITAIIDAQFDAGTRVLLAAAKGRKR